MEDDDQVEVAVTGFVSNEGTLWLLSGIVFDEPERTVTFACEPRYAVDILAALQLDEHPVASVPPYMIVGEF